jgi:hypothetical protein
MQNNKRKKRSKKATGVMTKAQVRAWAKRWQLVNAREIEELRATPVTVKYRQLVNLMRSAHELGWVTTTNAEVNEVRERWKRLRRANGG